MYWLRKCAVVTAVSTALFFTGCGTENPQECVYAVQKALDKSEFSKVISRLENNQTCNGAMSKKDALVNLGAAYVGAAGIDIASLLKIYSQVGPLLPKLQSGNYSSLTSEDLVVLEEFVNTLSIGAIYLDQAGLTFKALVAQESYTCPAAATAPYNVTLACSMADLKDMNKTLSNVLTPLKTASKLSTGFGDDFATFTSITEKNATLALKDDVNENNKSDSFEVLTCAMGTASAGPIGVCKEPTIAYRSEANVTFIDPANTLKTGVFTPRTYEVNATVNANDNGEHNKSYYKLIDRNGTFPAPATTKGNCNLQFIACDTVNYSASCYPCPVISAEGNASTTSAALLDVINADDTTLMTQLLGSDFNASAYEQNASDNNTSVIVYYLRLQNPDVNESNTTGDLTAEELAAFLELYSK